MPLPDVLSNTLFHLVQSAPTRGALREQGPVDILRSVTASPANNDRLTFLIPLQNRAGADSEFSTHFEWY